MTLPAGHFDHHLELLEVEVDPGDVLAAGQEHHLLARRRESRLADQLEEPSFEMSVDAGIDEHLLHESASPPSRASERRQASSEHFGRRQLQPDGAVDRRLDSMRVRPRQGEVEDGPGCRHHPEAVDRHVIDRFESFRGVHGEGQQCRSPGPFDRELDGVRTRPVEAVQCGGGFETHPAPLAEAEQPAAQSPSVGVGGSAERVDTRCEPEDPAVGDQTPLRPRCDAMGSDLVGGDHAVLVGSEIGECSTDVHTGQWAATALEWNPSFA